MTDDERRAYVAGLPDTGSFIRRPAAYAGKVRPDANAAEAAGVDLEALDAWVRSSGGELRTARPPASGGLRPGRRIAPPPPPPQRYYVLPAAALVESVDQRAEGKPLSTSARSSGTNEID